jgi:hypothetical protein
VVEPPEPAEVLPVTAVLPDAVADVDPLEDVEPDPVDEVVALPVVALPDVEVLAPPAPVSPVVALMTQPEAKAMAPIPNNTRAHCDRMLFIRGSSKAAAVAGASPHPTTHIRKRPAWDPRRRDFPLDNRRPVIWPALRRP